MNLLPKSTQDFSKTEYWNSFFKKRGSQSFEWYGEYPELSGHLHKYIKIRDALLVLGCGNSTLSADLYDVGFRNMTNIDISNVVIKQMTSQHSKMRPDLKFIQMDALNMTFKNDEFGAVLDKGTLDALMPDNSPDVQSRIEKLFSEVERVLRPGGRWICISLLQEHVLSAVLKFFPVRGWMVRICRCIEAEQKSAEEGENCGLPVFVIVCTKVKLPAEAQVLELLMAQNGVAERMPSAEILTEYIQQIQQAAMLCSRLGTSHVAGHGEISLDLFAPNNCSPRYTVFIRDKLCAIERSRKFAAFIVPQGRESEWLFGSAEGRESLQDTVGFDRLAVVTLNRDHSYTSLDEVKKEINDCILQVAPKGNANKIPFLSVGEEIGSRKLLAQLKSPISGDIVVEEVEGDQGELFRRLIFLDNPRVIQSEAKIKTVKTRKGSTKSVIDISYLSCDHHIYMSVGVSLALKAPSAKRNNVLLIGLGGGGLCSYLHACFHSVDIDAVDIDPMMEKIAREYFGFPKSDKIKLHFDDGAQFLKSAAGSGLKYDSILFDVDSKNSSSAMRCPPKAFLQEDVLDAVKKCLKVSGVFVLNFVSRSKKVRDEVLSDMKKYFQGVSSFKLKEDVNEVIFCSSQNVLKDEMSSAAKMLNDLARLQKIRTEDIVDVSDLLGGLELF